MRVKYYLYHLQNNKLLTVLVFFCMGVITKELNLLKENYLITITALLLIFIFILSFRKSFLTILLILTSILFGVVRHSQYYKNNFLINERLFSKEYTGNAKVISDIQERGTSLQYTVRLNKGNALVQTSHRTRYLYGDLLKIKGKLNEPSVSEEFSYKGYLEANRINFIIYNPDIELIEQGNLSLNRIASTFRLEVKNKISEYFHEPEASLLSGLVIGDEIVTFRDKFSNAMKISGTSHIVAISGYNVGLVINFIDKLSGIINRKKVQFIIFAGLFIFTLIVGTDNLPAMRASLMAFILLIGKVIGRRGGQIKLLILVISIMILFNPLVVRLVSFQLSVVATAGIVLYTEYFEKIKTNFLPKFISEQIPTSLAAFLWTSPIIISTFGSLSLLAIIPNLLILFMVPFATVLGILFVFFSFLNDFLSQLIYLVEFVVLKYISNIIYLFGDLRIAFFENIQISSYLVIFLYILLLVIVNELSYKKFIQGLSPQ